MQTLGMMKTIEIPAEKLNFCPTLLFAVQCAKSKHFGRVFHRLFWSICFRKAKVFFKKPVHITLTL